MKRTKIFIATCGLLGITMVANAQKEVKIDSNYANSYYLQRMEYFKKMPHVKNEIVFLGNSITERGEWQEILSNSRYPIVNRGIGGDNSFGILARMDEILTAKPKAIFLMDGINDLFRKLPYEVSIYNYKRIIRMIKAKSPKTRIYIESALPINEEMTTADYTKGRNVMVPVLNAKIKQLAEEEKITYINIVPLFQDDKGNLKKEMTIDGVHLKASAYIDWVAYLKELKYL
ncbi:MAG: GDSL-type esterase/lipase family protein [Candidatus Pedobacter colombiensis]|uniref:GDSL-type esterase/lipase family protein n=1 Tax=Candidatus Pedobacter colombiensis TaxID=3121371 RepID=A0AAJ5W6D3_9SPHI|nr:GDSL-type esterase/lipase family protein [Pedobacter sp.]WEK18056.1 MAG: GDSL-type esterase/lipase family protein [Pedobacter sp.]